MKLILASNSPRRKKILTDLGLDFEVVPSNYDEKLSDDIFSYEKNYKCFGVKKDSEWSNHLTSISCFDRYKEIRINDSREQTISIDISSWKGRMQIAFGTYFTSSGNDVSTNILKIWLE